MLMPVDDLARQRAPLIERLLHHTRPGEVVTPAALPGLLLVRVDRAAEQVCGLYQPCVALVLQGSKRVLIGEQTLHYDPQHFFVTPLDLPSLATIEEASPERPFLSLALQLDLRLLSHAEWPDRDAIDGIFTDQPDLGAAACGR